MSASDRPSESEGVNRPRQQPADSVRPRQPTGAAPDLPESVPAPVQPGDVVGRVNVIVDGRSVAQIPVAAAEGVEAKGMALDRIWRNWMGHF